MKKQMLKQVLRRFRFTMVEMLTATGVLALIMYSLLSLLDQSQRAMTIGMSRMDVYQDAKLALDMMQDDISSMDIEQMEIKLGSKSKKVFEINNKGDGFTIYTTRYNVISEFCKVEYKFNEQDGTLEQTITKVKKNGTSYSDSQDKETIAILNNVYSFHVYTRNTNDDSTLGSKSDKINDPYNYCKDDGYTCDRGIYLDLELVDSQMMSAGKTYDDKETDGFTSNVRKRVEKAMKKSETNIAYRVHAFTRYVYMDLSYLNK